MSQIGRPIKNLEPPRPLKTSTSRSNVPSFVYEVQSIEELITLTENIASNLSAGQYNADNMNILLSNLRVHGPQLEIISKDTLDRAFITFRNASQDERLNIISRMHLLELIELRAKSWQISDGLNTYYKHKATDVHVQPEIPQAMMIDLTLLGTSPPSSTQNSQMLSPGELIRASGKFNKPTKIPGKNYSKDEVVIRNADSGKVMGIKGRRVHMIEELSETIISFQRVNPGAKERLVQITGPGEDNINCAKQLIEDTIRRNASPVRSDAPQGGSCSSLASSASDEAVPRANRNSMSVSGGQLMNNFNGVPNQATTFIGGIGVSKTQRNTGRQLLSHSLSTNDASLGEYKYTVDIGNHSIKITGDRFELVQMAKLVLDDYFSSNEFLQTAEASAALDGSMNSTASTPTMTAPASIPLSHQLNSSSPFADSGIGLNMMSSSRLLNNNSVDIDDDVFIVENDPPAISNQPAVPLNGLTRSRRSHFSRKDSTPEGGKMMDAKELSARVVHEYDRLMYYAKSPHSWALPKDWVKICEKWPSIVRNKNLDDEKDRFDADKHMLMLKSNPYAKFTPVVADDNKSDSPDPE
ncbi:eukaryotic translation initiation factor 4E-binding protein Mextli isoform X1 [Bradysia coprophila]|uniref:eukaryotic translation initiation factor 4E-binding protein Mextli isoform X1 n=1 Tax=Bradysia coprophila TaxID=38358 RepID=UPI00187DCF18|nr:eukaryotic translation initiation factor 4E-binding protein Mextli isoform X1 [Bradysia coprophila]XP_037047724.1 eukaryotic translation initiation factor 4E-binding protein Mextli isoform X1 [Bradysia coprophila]XP_037047725.1 eukaryotic translation initiation factor 4E-binding protein Mextli isoform X1 [Bradysia coprophila]